MANPYQVVKDFEQALCDYTGAPYAVAVTSCTMALLLSCLFKRSETGDIPVSIPNRTYVSVPQSIKHAGYTNIAYDDSEWLGMYELHPLGVWDSARWLTGGIWSRVKRKSIYQYLCVSFHWTKTLAIGQGGAILHDDPVADEWFRRARFDGRTEGVAPKDDSFTMLGYHCYISPRDAAEGLTRLANLPLHNPPLPNDPYPDLSQFEVLR